MNVLAYVCAVLKCVIYGSTPFFTDALNETVDTLDLLSLRFLLSFAVMWSLKSLKIIKIGVGVKDIFVKNERTPFIKNLLLAAMFEPVLYMLFETLGISMTTGVTTAVIISLSPIISCIAGFLFFKDRPTPMQAVFIVCGIFGAMFIAVSSSASGGGDSPVGIIFLFCALVSGALFLVFSRKSSKHFSSMEITYISCVLGAFAFNAVNIVRHIADGNILNYFEPYFDPANLIAFAVLGILSTVVATCMNNYALSKLKISTMTAFGGISTVVTVLIGVIFAGESLEYYHFIGFPFIIARMIGVSVIAIRRDREKEKANSSEKKTANT